jgi:transcriptional regulator with XRE-family HTH domain
MTHGPRTDLAIGDVLPEILAARNLSLRALATAIDVSPSHLSRALRGQAGKHLSLGAIEAIAAAVDVPATFFREYRTEQAVRALQNDVSLANKVFDLLDRPNTAG